MEVSHEFLPRSGGELEVLVVARISGGPAGRKKERLQEQVDRLRHFIGTVYRGPMNFHSVATESSGERLVHAELANLIRSRKFDVLVVEDLGRLGRTAAAREFCRLSVEHGVRIVAANEGIDTAEQSGKEAMIAV